MTEPEKPASKTRKSKTPTEINDLNLDAWRDYDDIWTDSLWRIPERDRSGAHAADYHGNFVPQVPNQIIRRFTKPRDVVIDPFLGSGTTLIECQRLGRHGVGIELLPHMAKLSAERIAREANPHGVITEILAGDSGDAASVAPRIAAELKRMERTEAQLVVLHPPYHSIIKFSDCPDDLSNCSDVETFLHRFGDVVDTVTPFLEKGRFLTLVIGDTYADGEWVPLGFQCMQEILTRDYSLKSIVVKDIHGNRAKRNLENFWRYRALAGNFYIFKHEYVMFFQKRERRRAEAIKFDEAPAAAPPRPE
jgi:hypothetical protein